MTKNELEHEVEKYQGLAAERYNEMAKCREHERQLLDQLAAHASEPKVSPIGKRCYPGILHAQDTDGNCLICKPAHASEDSHSERRRKIGAFGGK